MTAGDCAFIVVPAYSRGSGYPGLVYAWSGDGIRALLEAAGLTDEETIQASDLELPGTGDRAPGPWIWEGTVSGRRKRGVWRRPMLLESQCLLGGVHPWPRSAP